MAEARAIQFVAGVVPILLARCAYPHSQNCLDWQLWFAFAHFSSPTSSGLPTTRLPWLLRLPVASRLRFRFLRRSLPQDIRAVRSQVLSGAADKIIPGLEFHCQPTQFAKSPLAHLPVMIFHTQLETDSYERDHQKPAQSFRLCLLEKLRNPLLSLPALPVRERSFYSAVPHSATSCASASP